MAVHDARPGSSLSRGGGGKKNSSRGDNAAESLSRARALFFRLADAAALRCAASSRFLFSMGPLCASGGFGGVGGWGLLLRVLLIDYFRAGVQSRVSAGFLRGEGA